MPIRINLLAEEQGAEEMRRRDPIKRAVFAGSALGLLMLGWIGITQMNVSAARRELADYDARLKKVDESSKQVRQNQMTSAEIAARLKGLERYSALRFFQGSLLNAIQEAAVESVRLMNIKTEQKYGAGEIQKFNTADVTVNLPASPSWWKFWASAPEPVTLETLANNALATVTNKAPFTTNLLAYTMTINPVSTNESQNTLGLKLEFSNPVWAMERNVIEIRGRDYGTPSGAAIDEFARRINNSPYFKELLVPVEGFRFTERPPQARPDPQDPVNPNALFVPFTIELTLKERIMTNE